MFALTMKRLTWIFQSMFLILICDSSKIQKRQLVFPPQSVMQLAFGVATPAQVKGRTIATNMGLMFNINLPTNQSVWYPWRSDYRRKRSADSDQAFYSLIENTFTMIGFDGRACTQKMICQMKEDPIESDSFCGQILTVIFGYGPHDHSHWETPHHNTSCDSLFPTCKHTPIDFLEKLYTTGE